MEPALVMIGDACFSINQIILATRQPDGSVLVNLTDKNEHCFYGQSAELVWAALGTHSGLVMGKWRDAAPATVG